MAEKPDHDRLRSLDERLAKMRGKAPERIAGATGAGFSQGEVAWRMVLELVSGMVLGLGIGYGLDRVFGTLPIFLILLGLMGFIAGVRVMIRTAADMNKAAPAAGTEQAAQPPGEGEGRG
ncbi:MAG: AtpZ/AtpI family protein [Paracoccaceae bacterium]